MKFSHLIGYHEVTSADLSINRKVQLDNICIDQCFNFRKA